MNKEICSKNAQLIDYEKSLKDLKNERMEFFTEKLNYMVKCKDEKNKFNQLQSLMKRPQSLRERDLTLIKTVTKLKQELRELRQKF